MSEYKVNVAGSEDEGAVTGALTLAFSGDPMARWAWEDPQAYLRAFPRFVQKFGGRAIQLGTAHYAEGFSGVALWYPPGEGPDEDTLVAVIEETTSEARRQDLFAILEQMGNFHPEEPHWYLPLIGVDPRFQSRGVGSILMKHALAICDREGVAAYLESSSPRNIPFYERHGFDILGEIQHGDSPVMAPMLRKPR